MILWPQEDGSVLATPQPAHALISGQLLRGFAARPEPFEPVCTAAALHDCPWLPWEAAPQYDPGTGLPRQFNALSGAEHVPMWEQGVRGALANWGLWVGLLVLMHGAHIYRLGILHNRMAPDGDSQAAMEGYLAREAGWAAEIMGRLGVTEAEVRPAQRAIAVVDGIALALCWGQPRFDCAGVALTRTAPFAATLDPWPLEEDRVTVATEALVLSPRYDNAAAMRAAIAAAPRRTLSFTLHRA